MKWIYCFFGVLNFVFVRAVHNKLNANITDFSGRLPVGAVPFLVAIHSDNTFLCCGTILDPNFVLTAAECVRGSEGSLVISAATESIGNYGQSSFAINVIYDDSTYYDNVALIELGSRIIFNENVTFLRVLPEEELLRITKKHEAVGYIAGFGNAQSPSKPTRYSEMAAVRVLSRKVCPLMLPPTSEFNKDINVCLSAKWDQFSAMYYGGPLIIDNSLVAINVRNQKVMGNYLIYSKVYGVFETLLVYIGEAPDDETSVGRNIVSNEPYIFMNEFNEKEGKDDEKGREDEKNEESETGEEGEQGGKVEENEEVEDGEENKADEKGDET